MKIRYQIWLAIMAMVMISMGIFGAATIENAHKENLKSEQERSCREIPLYISVLENGDNLLGSMDTAIDWYNLQYQSRGIQLGVYDRADHTLGNGGQTDTTVPTTANPGQKTDATVRAGDYINTGLTTPGIDEKRQQVITADGRHYLMTTCRMTETDWPVLWYARDISSIYEQRRNNIRQMLLTMAVLALAATAISYALSNYITRPLEQLNNDVKSMGQGNYIPQYPGGRDEFNELRRNFAVMADTITQRENSLAQELQRRKDFVAAMTHEMNTPLTSIRGYTQFLQGANVSEEQQYQALCNLSRESRRMTDMYDKMRQIYLMEGSVPARDRIEWKSLLTDMQEELASLLSDKDIHLEEQLLTDWIVGDRTLLLILLCNFTKNAILHSDCNGHIRITSDVFGDGQQQFTVRDWGCGIPREQIDRVTEPFYRVDKSRSRATGGTGLGLYLCKQIIDQLDGTLEIESQEGAGTLIRVTF